MAKRMTHNERAAFAGPQTWETVHAALDAAREAISTARNAPGAYHYAHACGDYDLADGRTVTVRLRPASDGGVLLGQYQYAVWTRREERMRWRTLA